MFYNIMCNLRFRIAILWLLVFLGGAYFAKASDTVKIAEILVSKLNVTPDSIVLPDNLNGYYPIEQENSFSVGNFEVDGVKVQSGRVIGITVSEKHGDTGASKLV
ncbi:MAG: hypothetical protein AAGH72_04170 [Verrucomicrobiota bacterium]